MTSLFFDFIPVLLFFLAFKWYGIYTATVVGIISTAFQAVGTFFWKKRWDKGQLFTLVIFILFGGMTLYFHDPLFVKWKPSIIFWLFGLVFLFTHFFSKKPLIQRLMQTALEKQAIPNQVLKKMNLAWGIFFILLGTLNIFIAYRYTTEAWVNFKLYGILGLLLSFSVLQAMFIVRYIDSKNSRSLE